MRSSGIYVVDDTWVRHQAFNLNGLTVLRRSEGRKEAGEEGRNL
jgi:hypothetical protein